MTPEERQLLTGLFDRVHAASSAPRDPDAQAFIDSAVRAMPFAPYILAQTALVQEEALRAASERVHQLEAQVRDLQSNAAAPPAPAASSFLGGIGHSIFGGAPAAPQTPAPPAGNVWGRPQPAQPAPAAPGNWGGQQPQAGPWGQQGGNQFAPQAASGGGFLKGALGAAAGVAGGVLLADSIRGMMGGHNSPFGTPFGGGGESVVNNYYGADSSQAALHQQDVADDAAQDAADDSNTASYDNNSGAYSDDSQDA